MNIKRIDCPKIDVYQMLQRISSDGMRTLFCADLRPDGLHECVTQIEQRDETFIGTLWYLVYGETVRYDCTVEFRDPDHDAVYRALLDQFLIDFKQD